MSDIIDLLRNEMKHSDELCYNAADEIERLIGAMKAAQECIDADDVIGAYNVLTKAINGESLDD